MSTKTVAVDLNPANLIWLKARAGGRNLSETLNDVLDRARGSHRTSPPRRETIRTVRGTIRLPESDPDLKDAQEAVRDLFRRSIERTSGFLADDEQNA